VYSSKPDKLLVVVGYKAETIINIEISDLALVPTIIDEAMAAGATTIHRLSYTRSDMESYKESLISEACLDGLKKANAAAHALGVVLGAPISIEVYDAFTGREVAPVMALKAATGTLQTR